MHEVKLLSIRGTENTKTSLMAKLLVGGRCVGAVCVRIMQKSIICTLFICNVHYLYIMYIKYKVHYLHLYYTAWAVQRCR